MKNVKGNTRKAAKVSKAEKVANAITMDGLTESQRDCAIGMAAIENDMSKRAEGAAVQLVALMKMTGVTDGEQWAKVWDAFKAHCRELQIPVEFFKTRASTIKGAFATGFTLAADSTYADIVKAYKARNTGGKVAAKDGADIPAAKSSDVVAVSFDATDKALPNAVRVAIGELAALCAGRDEASILSVLSEARAAIAVLDQVTPKQKGKENGKVTA